MSNEITMSAQMKALLGDLDFTRKTGSIQLDLDVQLVVHSVKNIGDVHEALDMGDVTDSGPCLFLNLDDTYSISIGIDVTGSFVSFFDIPPNSFVCGADLATDAPYALCSDSSGGNLEYVIFQKRT